MKIIPFIALSLLFLGVGCSQQVLTLPEIFMNKVAELETSSSNRAIRLQFRGANNETGFIGYDVYVGTQASVYPERPVVNPSALVTLPLSKSIPDTLHTLVLTNDSYTNNLINGKEYHVTVCAVNLRNGAFRNGPFSSLSSVVPMTNWTVELYDQTVSGQTNDGILLQVSGIPVRLNVPDTIAANTVSFYLSSFANPITPALFLSVYSNEVIIQDLGSTSSLSDRHTVPTKSFGYSGWKDRVLLLEGHTYAFYHSGFDYYGKLRCESAPQTVSLSSPSTKVRLSIMVHPLPGRVKF